MLGYKLGYARYSAMAACEPCQVRNEAALSNSSHVSLFTWHLCVWVKDWYKICLQFT